MITNITVQAKEDVIKELQIDDKVEQGIQQLASQHVVEHQHSEQQPALKVQQDELLSANESEIAAEPKTIDMEPASTKHS